MRHYGEYSWRRLGSSWRGDPLFPPDGRHPRHFPNPDTLNFARNIRLADGAEIKFAPGIGRHRVTLPVLLDR